MKLCHYASIKQKASDVIQLCLVVCVCMCVGVHMPLCALFSAVFSQCVNFSLPKERLAIIISEGERKHAMRKKKGFGRDE